MNHQDIQRKAKAVAAAMTDSLQQQTPELNPSGLIVIGLLLEMAFVHGANYVILETIKERLQGLK